MAWWKGAGGGGMSKLPKKCVIIVKIFNKYLIAILEQFWFK